MSDERGEATCKIVDETKDGTARWLMMSLLQIIKDVTKKLKDHAFTKLKVVHVDVETSY